jgi:hypothetical protein
LQVDAPIRLAVAGRPNVGKSTLFNRMTKSRDAIVADFAGLTRDRHYGDGRLADREYIVIDTGGFEPDSSTGIVKEMAKQTRQAVAEADAVIFVVDIEIFPRDRLGGARWLSRHAAWQFRAAFSYHLGYGAGAYRTVRAAPARGRKAGADLAALPSPGQRADQERRGGRWRRRGHA